MKKAVATLCCASFLLLAGRASATPPTEQDIQAVWDDINKQAVMGPDEVKLSDQLTLHVEDDMAYVPVGPATRWMGLMGNTVDDSFLGVVMPADDRPWFVTVDYVNSGHIADDDARDWDADELLDNLREGTEQANDYRRDRGIAPIEVVGWVEKPQYDGQTHRLAWSALARDVGTAASPQDTVNYNTYVLGREGYVAMNLVTEINSIDQDKQDARELLNDVHFVDGRRYADFNEDTDQMASYGLAALIGGVAAKKAGLLALIAAFFLKAWKLVLLGGAAVVVGIRKFFGGKD
ncbi:DUF2167 domain-containing protein [Marinobacter sp. NFXS9]|uniref:DUF2167 domain-containing protein n=1 Tax=Marinobacter sp. NFXS9 TaxID=2818433 RepID=UPI0032E03E68